MKKSNEPDPPGVSRVLLEVSLVAAVIAGAAWYAASGYSRPPKPVAQAVAPDGGAPDEAASTSTARGDMSTGGSVAATLTEAANNPGLGSSLKAAISLAKEMKNAKKNAREVAKGADDATAAKEDALNEAVNQ